MNLTGPTLPTAAADALGREFAELAGAYSLHLARRHGANVVVTAPSGQADATCC